MLIFKYHIFFIVKYIFFFKRINNTLAVNNYKMKKRILIIGAGRSSSDLIQYLLEISIEKKYFITIADYNLENASRFIKDNNISRAIEFDANDSEQRSNEIKNSDLVVSMLPASMHILVAKDCVLYKKHLVTASYVSDEISKLNIDARNNGVLLLNEIGLDPGIDHMSAMKIIDDIKKDGGVIRSFKSFCGGLVHPDCDNNPWNYKFSWNPRNVVLAGLGTAQYIEEGLIKYIPYNKLFLRTQLVDVLNLGTFEAYANRDSLSYRKEYQIEDVPTLIRGTLRKVGFSSSWNSFVQLGITNDTYIIPRSNEISCRQFINLFLPFSKHLSVEEKFCNQLGIQIDSDEFNKFKWLDIFSEKKIKIKNASPAKLLQKILEDKWSLLDGDKDMIIMQHQFEFIKGGVINKLHSSLVVYGENQINTSMSKTVGLPVAIAVKLILENKIKSIGVKIPTSSEIYIPVLCELEKKGISFVEEIKS